MSLPPSRHEDSGLCGSFSPVTVAGPPGTCTRFPILRKKRHHKPLFGFKEIIKRNANAVKMINPLLSRTFFAKKIIILL